MVFLNNYFKRLFLLRPSISKIYFPLSLRVNFLEINSVLFGNKMIGCVQFKLSNPFQVSRTNGLPSFNHRYRLQETLTSNKHRCNLSAHAHVLSLIEGKWRILKELCCFGFQEDKRCFFFFDCSLIIWKRQQRVLCFRRPRII